MDSDTSYLFTDVEIPNLSEINHFMDVGILEFLKIRNKKIIDIFSSKTILLELINYLKYENHYRFEYKDILYKLDMSYKVFVRLRDIN